MHFIRSAAAVFAAAAIFAGPAGAQNAVGTMPPMENMKDSVTVTFAAQNNSGETGVAMLTAMGDKTKIKIVLKGAPADAQPVGIHSGACGKLNSKAAYALKDAVEGRSMTVIDVPLAKLTDGTWAIDVQRSAADHDTSVSCGDIKKSGT